MAKSPFRFFDGLMVNFSANSRQVASLQVGDDTTVEETGHEAGPEEGGNLPRQGFRNETCWGCTFLAANFWGAEKSQVIAE